MSLKILEVAGVDPRLIRRLIEIGVESLTPVQELAVRKGVFRRKNIFICAPASSGKTLLSYIAALAMALREPKSKALILVPLRSQADEVNEYLNRVYTVLGVNIVRLNELDSSRLADANIIISTFKEMDSALLVGYSWFKDVSLIILDEFQLLGQHEKGGLLENLIIVLVNRFSGAQFIYLSDIVGNAFEISEWLNAELAQIFTTPLPVRYSVLIDEDNRVLKNIIEETVKTNGQVIVFTSGLNQVLQLCSELEKYFKNLVSGSAVNEIQIKLNTLREKGENTYTREYLSYYIKRGIGFHTPSLTSLEKLVVEELFNARILKIVVSTPEISSAVNMHPRVIVFKNIYKSMRAEKNRREAELLNPNIVHSILGKAGNYKYDREAYGIILVEDSVEKERAEKHFFKKNIRGELLPRYEYLKSILVENSGLEYMLLYLIALYGAVSVKQLIEHFQKSLYYRQNPVEKRERLNRLLQFKTVKEVLKDRVDYTTRLNAEKISLTMVKNIRCEANMLKASVLSSTGRREHEIQVMENGYMSCDCEYWRFKAVKERKICKHLAALMLKLEAEKKPVEAYNIILKALNPGSLVLKLAVEGYININESVLTVTDKGRISAYTSIQPELLNRLTGLIEDRKIDNRSRFLKCISEIIENSLVELPYSSVKSKAALEYLAGVLEEHPDGFEPGDFRKLLNYADWIFNALTMIIKYTGRRDLEDELLKFKEKLYEKTM